MHPILFDLPAHYLCQNLIWWILPLALVLAGYIAMLAKREGESFPTDLVWLLAGVVAIPVVARVYSQMYTVPEYLPVYSYGAMMATGILVALGLLYVRSGYHGLEREITLDMTFFVVVGGLLGSRIFYYFIEHPEEFAGRPWTAFFDFTGGGLTFYGSVMGGVPALLLFCKIYKVPFLQLLDLTAPSLMMGSGFGRIGCYLYGCCWGEVAEKGTYLPTCVFPKGSPAFDQHLSRHLISPETTQSLPVYFTQIYSSVMSFTLVGILLLFSRFGQKRYGSAFALLLILYPIERSIVEMYRGDNPRVWGEGFTIAQMVSFGVVLFGVALALYTWKYGQKVYSGDDESGRDEEREDEKFMEVDGQKLDLTIPSDFTPHLEGNPVKMWLGSSLMNFFGWKVVGELPKEKKFVVCGAPHTTALELPVVLGIAMTFGRTISWIGKQSIFKFPFGPLMKALGGVPVNRKVSANFVEQMVEQFNRRDEFILGILPEGTRKRTEHWRTGFYYIAVQAKVPIVLAFFDYDKGVCGVGPTFYPTGDIDRDLEVFQKFYRDLTPKVPEKFGPIRWKDQRDDSGETKTDETNPTGESDDGN